MGNIPFVYKGKVENIDIECKNLANQFPNHKNFLRNYFLPNKREYFLDQSLNYYQIPNDCRSNSFLENYNG